MQELRDIKDIVEVSDNSFLLLIVSILLIILLLSVIVYLYKTRRKKRRKLTPRELALKKLKEINYQDSKDIVYTFEANVEPFLDEKNTDEYKKIVNELAKYKYKKEIPKMDENIITRVQSFIKRLK